MVVGPGYTVDASKRPSQALSIFAESLKINYTKDKITKDMCVRCRDGRQRLSY